MRPYRDAASRQDRPGLDSELTEDSHRDKRVRVGVEEPVATMGTDAELLLTYSVADSTSQACSSSQHVDMNRLSSESICGGAGEVATPINLDGCDIWSSDITNVYGGMASDFTGHEATQQMFFSNSFDPYCGNNASGLYNSV